MCKMFRLLVILLCLVVAVTLEYDLKCPDSGEWRLRAIGFNCSIKSQYVCLFKYPERTYHETCDGLDYSSIGSKLIYEPYFNKAQCSYERYQPFPFSTDGNSKCVYEKSFCTEKGQYLFQRGSQRGDITCGCDLTKGYEFVSKPNHDCYCVPSTDDCSCHKIPCNNLVDQCPQDRDEMLTISMFTTFQENRFKDTINIFDDENNGKTYRFQCLYISSILLAVMILVVILVFIFAGFEHPQDTIRHLTEQDKIRFNKLLQTKKTENRYFVRIMIVGKESSGKTCLLRRLLKEDINGVTSTDGVDIVVRRCKIDISDGRWIIGIDCNDDKVVRIKRALNPNVENRDAENVQEVKANNLYTIQNDEMSTNQENIATDAGVGQDKREDNIECSPLVTPENFTTEPNISLDKNDDTNDSSSLETHDHSTTHAKVNRKTHKDKKRALVMPEDLMSHVFSESTINTPSNNYALCELRDFAGQTEFSATHQAFLTSCAVYLVVVDMEDDIEIVDFWFDSIHCHRTSDTERVGDGHFDPPILLVFTGKDKYTEAGFKEREKELKNQIHQVFGFQSKYHHLHYQFYLSNLTDSDEEFEKLRNAIFNSAQKMECWGNAFPLGWVLLEHLIEINKNNGKNFINFTEMSELAKHPDINIVHKEDLLLFLRFQHNVGNIIFFDIRDLIILRPQWLADAFRCLVSDRIGNKRLFHLDDWTLFKQQGKISESLITELLESKAGGQFSGQNTNLHKVMEELDILVKIENSSYYIMPSMMPFSTFDDVCAKFGIIDGKCKRTSWLCFKFDFLPPSFFNHLSAWFIRNYDPSKVDSDIALFRGICMFDIDASGCKKILVTMSTDTIALQVVTFFEQQAGFGSMCSDIYSEVTQLIEDIKERYKVMISFKLHFKCSDGYHFQGTLEYEKLTSKKVFFCTEHNQTHLSVQIYSPWMNNKVNKIPDRANIRTKQDDHNSKNEPNKEAQNQESGNYNLSVSVTLRQQFKVKKSKDETLDITSCIKTGNTLVFTDNNKRLIICNSDGTDTYYIPLPYRPWHMTVISSDTVAVSCRWDRTILIINISTCSVVHTILTSGDCWGISCNDNNLYVVSNMSRIHVMDLTGRVIRTIPEPSNRIIDITVDRDRLVCIDGTSIYCCLLDGKLLWKYKKDTFQDLRGVTTDNKGNVYVTKCKTDSVVVVSEDGKFNREIITKLNELEEPWGICFDKKDQIMLTCNDQVAFLFDVKHINKPE